MCYYENVRKTPLINDKIYHLFSRSIANYKIFNDKKEFARLLHLLRYYQFESNQRFSNFLESRIVTDLGLNTALQTFSNDKIKLIDIIAYCLMPTHIHLVLKQLSDRGISTYLSNVLNGYTRYFNTRHKRKGPLWESEFKNVLIDRDELLLHVTRYIHLNPVTAYIVEKPEKWDFSSYKEYVSSTPKDSVVCNYDGILDINPAFYRKFTNDQISYQRELAIIKDLIIE